MEIYSEIAHRLRAGTWDIVEDWLEESKLYQSADQIYLPAEPKDFLDELPTLIGGVAKVVQDPMYLMDLDAGGNLNAVCRRFGQMRHEAGYQIDKLLNDFSLLRQQLWIFCERTVPLADGSLFELEKRLNLAVDRIAAAAVEAFYNRSCAELIELAQKDKLTGFLHLKAFNRLLETEAARSRRYRYPLALIAVDIDNFKRYNLEEGRLEGNRLLQEVAWEMARAIRATDFAARIGGDEFCVLMPQTSLIQAKQAAERLRRTVRKLRRDDHPVTASFGVAVLSEESGGAAGLADQTRQAVFQARQDGGDVVRVGPA